MHPGGHHEINHHRFRLKFTELNEIYIFNSLRFLAFSFVAIFIPIYLLNLGYSIHYILAFYVIFYLIETLVEFASVYLIRYIGPKHVIAISVPFAIIHFFLLQTLAQYNWPLYLVALTGAISLGLYWQAYHFDFSKSKRQKKATKDVSKGYFFIYFAMMAAPLIGGMVSENFGMHTTFMIVILILVLGSLALFKTGEIHRCERQVDFKKINFKEIKRDIVSRFGMGWEASAAMVIWPLFIFLILESYQSVGIVTSASMVLAMIVAYFVGKKADYFEKRKSELIRVSSITKSVIYVLKMFVTTVFTVYVVNIFRAIIGAVSAVNLDSEYYLHADKEPRSEYIFIIEVVIDISRAVFFLILLVASYYLSLRGVAVLGFFLGAVGAILASFMPISGLQKGQGGEGIKIMPRPQKRSSNA